MTWRVHEDMPLHRTENNICVYCGRTSKEIKTGKYRCFRKTKEANSQ